MNISLNELLILVQFTNTVRVSDRTNLAYHAAKMAPQPNFDRAVAETLVDSLKQRRLLAETRYKGLELTREGWAAVMEALPVIENIRAAIAACAWQVVR